VGHTCKIEFPVQERGRKHTYTCLVNVFCNKSFMCMDGADIWHITKLCDFMHVALLRERVGGLDQFNFSPWSVQFIGSHAVSHRYEVTATRV